VGARTLQPYFEEELGQSLNIVNKPGGGGWVGWAEIAQATPDGYTVGFINSPNFMSGYLNPELDIQENLDHLANLLTAASWLSSLDLPVRLVAIPEGALQGFNDEVLDLDHAEFARTIAIDIPGKETEFLGDLARKWNIYIMAQAKARHEEFADRFFNVGFILDPDGDVILRHHKVAPLYPVEHSVTPHNVWDRWVELYGETLDAFYPVVDTDIGRLGIMMANEGSYPENARGLAMNGAEVIYRASYPHPHTGNEFFEIQTRARALDNNVYVVAPNMGTYYLDRDSEIPIDTFGGRSLIVDYKGRIVGRHDYSGVSSYMAGTIDVGALRDFRARAQWDNWMKDLTTEQYQLIYRQEIYPKNLYLDRAPYTHAPYKEQVIDPQIEKMHELGIWRRPD
jgi:predicted amidohydrolase